MLSMDLRPYSAQTAFHVGCILFELPFPDPYGGFIRRTVGLSSIQHHLYHIHPIVFMGLHEVRQLKMQLATTSTTQACQTIYFSGSVAYYNSPHSAVIANKGTLTNRADARLFTLNEKYLYPD